MNKLKERKSRKGTLIFTHFHKTGDFEVYVKEIKSPPLGKIKVFSIYQNKKLLDTKSSFDDALEYIERKK